MNGKILVNTNVINPKHTKVHINILRELTSNLTVIETIGAEIQSFASDYRRKRIIKKTPDAIIAATAKHFKIPLLTFVSEFENIQDIDIILLKK